MQRTKLLNLYVIGVCLLGLGAIAVLTFARQLPALFPWPAFCLLSLLTVLGELYPVMVQLRSQKATITTSTSFAFALLLLVGPMLAAYVYGLASFLADARTGRSWTKIAFNVAQFALALAGGGLVLERFGIDMYQGALRSFTPRDLIPLLTSCAVVLVLNHLFIGIAVALSQPGAIAGLLRDWLPSSIMTGALLLLSPVLALVATHGLVLIPTLVVIVAVIYHSTRKSLEQEHAALHDPLTGLANRRQFERRLDEALANRDEGRVVAVALVDLDKFKPINDTLGHHVGDLVLQQIGPRLMDVVPEIEVLARLGGDEFAAFLRPLDEQQLPEICGRLAGVFTTPFAVDGHPLELGASIGLATAPSDGETVETLLERADIAMYAAKREGSGCRRFESERDASGRGQLELLVDLRAALQTGDQLVVHWQPIARVDDDDVDAAEALIRWQHPRFGMIYPDEFIPLAEKTDLIGPLTRCVLTQALRQCRAWHDQGLHLRVAVNLSAQNLRDDSFPLFVQRQLARHGVDGRWLKLEITEHTLLQDHGRVQQTLLELRSFGIRIAIDDFGTGYSSLMHLRYLPIDEIKIDKTFVQAMGADDTLVASIIHFGRSLGLQIVAEGVETGDALERLGLHGCDLAQGYYLARPAAAAAMTQWLRSLALDGAPWRPPAPREPADLLGGLVSTPGVPAHEVSLLYGSES